MAKNKKADNQVSAVRRAKHGWVLTVFFSILAVLWLYPIFLVAMNSLKKKGFITRYPFALPDHRSFFGIENFIKGVQKTNFFCGDGELRYHHGRFCGGNHSLYLHVRMVHYEST